MVVAYALPVVEEAIPSTYREAEISSESKMSWKKRLFVGFNKGIKGYKIWDPKDMKFIFSRDVTFDEVSMLKSKISRQVEIIKTKEVSQQVENDANPLSLESSASVRIIPRV